MKTERIFIENLKCSGCANTIAQSLMKIEGVQEVFVDNKHDAVEIKCADDFKRDLVVSELFHLGYPEMGHNSLGRKAKSYVSCAIGRVSMN